MEVHRSSVLCIHRIVRLSASRSKDFFSDYETVADRTKRRYDPW